MSLTGHWDAVNGEVPRCLAVQASMDRDRQLERYSISDVPSACRTRDKRGKMLEIFFVKKDTATQPSHSRATIVSTGAGVGISSGEATAFVRQGGGRVEAKGGRPSG